MSTWHFYICLLLSVSSVNCELPLQLNLPTGINKVTLQIQQCHNHLEFLLDQWDSNSEILLIHPAKLQNRYLSLNIPYPVTFLLVVIKEGSCMLPLKAPEEDVEENQKQQEATAKDVSIDALAEAV